MGNAKRVLLYQMFTVLALTGVGLLFEIMLAISLLIGSTISVLGTGLLAFGIFRKTSNKNPELLLQRFYIAEALKMFVVIFAFTLTFLLIEEADILALSGAYFVTQFIPTALAALQDNDT